MTHDLSLRGVWVTVNREVGEPVQGWLIGEIPQGILVALDEDLADVRVVSDYASIGFDHDKQLSKLRVESAEEIEEQLKATNAAILGPMRKAASRLRFDELQRFCQRSAELIEHLHFRPDVPHMRRHGQTPQDELAGFLTAQADRSASLHREVYSMMEDSGLTEILDEHGPRLVRLPPELVIPAHDLVFESREDLISSLTSAREARWSGRRHRRSLEVAEETRTRLLVEASRERPGIRDHKPKRTDDATPFSRWVGPSLRILAGTGLAAANVAIAVTAGLTATIVTIGATAVPVYVGVATSVYTGLVQVADGLEKIGRHK
jgi:hypothetical protein